MKLAITISLVTHHKLNRERITNCRTPIMPK